MFSFIRNRSVNSSGLMRSSLYDEKRFYDAFKKDIKRAKKEIIIESPYMTCRRTNELMPVFSKLMKKGVKIRINTRFPGHHDELLRIQAWMAYKKLKSLGIKVSLCNDLRHRKLAIIDGSTLWEGSLNILSQSNSREIMRRTESEELCRQMIRYTALKRWYW